MAGGGGPSVPQPMGLVLVPQLCSSHHSCESGASILTEQVRKVEVQRGAATGSRLAGGQLCWEE